MVDPSPNELRRIPIAILLVIALGGIVDLILDSPDSIWSFHVLFELAMLAFALGAAGYLWLRWQRTGDSLARTQEQLENRDRERDAWRGRAERLLRGLGEEIDRQLREWQLTPVERETALLLLKGLGHKEIAAIQGKSERTVRQHGIAVYRKSGLGGRAELSAFFLEDLLLPQEEPDLADRPRG
ncbi:MAG: LuxR C-terminal-related transcriptional regulator [Myxococcales bacterium]|nr:LuxR C-terminal-related transcriptional regulator [Myxococcales bacterium]